MLFAALDGEELGHHGAKAFIASTSSAARHAAPNVNLDMLSRNDANEIYAAGPYYSPGRRPFSQDVQTRASVKIRFGHDRPTRPAAVSRTGRIHPITACSMTRACRLSTSA